MHQPTRRPNDPKKASSAVVTRTKNGITEMLMGLRHPDVPTFPDFWSFPGGGVSKEDRILASAGDIWKDSSVDVSIIALFRELAEETGFALDPGGSWKIIGPELRTSICSGGEAWIECIENSRVSINPEEISLVTERTTPPLAPLRYSNRFYHLHLGDSMLEPQQPPGRSEFTEFKWWRPDDLLRSWEIGAARMAPPQVTFVRDVVQYMKEGGSALDSLRELERKPRLGKHKIEFAPGVECLPIPTETLPPSTHTNCFLLGRGKDLLIVDPAVQNDEAAGIIQHRLKSLARDGMKVVGILYTHRHPDHVGNQSMISKLIDAPSYGTKETLAEIGHGLEVSEGYVFDLGDGHPWEVLETPGHCPGMISLHADVGILSADNVTMVGTILVPSEDGSMAEYFRSLDRLLDLDPNLLFPSHGPVCAAPHRLLQRTHKHRMERHARVLDAVRSGCKSLDEIASFAYKDAPGAPIGLARDQSLSHLICLEEEGLIASDGNLYTIPDEN